MIVALQFRLSYIINTLVLAKLYLTISISENFKMFSILMCNFQISTIGKVLQQTKLYRISPNFRVMHGLHQFGSSVRMSDHTLHIDRPTCTLYHISSVAGWHKYIHFWCHGPFHPYHMNIVMHTLYHYYVIHTLISFFLFYSYIKLYVPSCVHLA